jgi:hypothetical protein
MNEHGDIWQEPTLFDQGGDVPVTSSSAPRDANYNGEVNMGEDDFLEMAYEDRWVADDEDDCEDISYEEASGDFGQWD